jgi:hypothetical protein
MDALHSALEIHDLVVSEVLYRLASCGATGSEVDEHLDFAQRETDLLGSFYEPHHGDTGDFIGSVSGSAPRRFG